MIFWLNGEYKENPVAIDVADRGFLLGDGVFETLWVEGGIPAFLDAHLERLKNGLVALAINAVTLDNIGDVIAGLAERNGLGEEKASARITITRGRSERGLLFPASDRASPTLLVTLMRAPNKTEDSPISLKLSRSVRCEESIASWHKTTNYIDNILARNEAEAVGADEAIMLNGRGRVACASSANIFVIKENGDIVTPSCAEGALNGIVRGLLLGSAAETGIAISEASVDLALLQQGAPFLTNSLIGLRQARLKDDGSAPAPLQVEIFNQLKTWYQHRLHRSLIESASAP
jgi:branched-subunit amino acid aminotransferase/4-amino-4-deoxychorismate lyase